MKHRLGRIKPLAFLMLMLTAIMITVLLVGEVEAETDIISIVPFEGNVGMSVQLQANITTTDGEYLVHFDGENVTGGYAVGNYVNAYFAVPHVSGGSHDVMIVDVAAGENDTIAFRVLPSYSLEIWPKPEPPAQRQEGDDFTVSVGIDGGESGKTYVANITVQDPANATYVNMLDVVTPENGSRYLNLMYPNDFSVEAHTNFTGEYKVFFNGTLATGQFYVGLTNATEYHRFQYVDIKAAGYKRLENVTVTVSFEGEVIPPEQNVTATEGGVVRANWVVPSNASMGIYTVSVTSVSDLTIKEPPDIQNITIPGFPVNITTINLAQEPVANVIVQVFENVAWVVNATSDSDGLASLMLEIGIYTGEAYFKDEKVGERSLNITQEALFNFTCNLTNLKILVTDDSGNRIPEVELYLTRENQTLITDINGTAVVHSLLPNVTYVLNASRYDNQFNATTIHGLLVNETAKPWFNLTITCPTLTLQVNVTDVDDQPITGATVEVQDVMGGLYYKGDTVEGIVILECTFGNYAVDVYASGIKINETATELFQNHNISIRCKLYGLIVSVKVVDYFGQPIANADVVLQREGLQPRSDTTKSDGVAAFADLIGGRVKLTVYLNDPTQPCMEKTFSVDSSTTIGIKIGRYVLVAGVLIEASHLATASIITAAIILFLAIEVYRRKRLKSKQASN